MIRRLILFTFLLGFLSGEALGKELSEQGYKALMRILQGNLSPSVQQKVFAEYSEEIGPVLHALAADNPETIPPAYRHISVSWDGVMYALLRADDPWAIEHLDEYFEARQLGDRRLGSTLSRAFNPRVLPVLVRKLNEALARPVPNDEQGREAYFFAATGVNLISAFVAASPNATEKERTEAAEFESLYTFTPSFSQKARSILQWWNGLPDKGRFTDSAPLDSWKRANAPNSPSGQSVSFPGSPSVIEANEMGSAHSAAISAETADNHWRRGLLWLSIAALLGVTIFWWLRMWRRR